MTATLPESHVVSRSRIASIDVVRGVVMILMAIDHVRVYSGLPAGGPTPGIFFTRWVTNFCAPAFIFLAGTSAFLHGRKHPGLSRFLLTRGAWLILLELTVLRVAWTFNFDFMHYEMAGVLWAIGWCMILLAGLVKLPLRTIGALGLLIIAAHNIVDPHLETLVPALGNSRLSGLWKILYLGFFAGPIRLGPDGPNLIVLYSIIPWIGVMAAGYAFGAVLLLDPLERDRICIRVGLGAVALFLVLRGFNLYGDPRPWNAVPGEGGAPAMPPLLAFLNTNKYPASLDFLLMTLGPTIALMPLFERARGAVARWITVFGRVPFFYYVLHIPADPRARDIGLVGSPRDGEPVALRQPSDGESAGPGGVHVEPGAAVCRLGCDTPRAVPPLPLVCGPQGTAEGLVARLPLSLRKPGLH